MVLSFVIIFISKVRVLDLRRRFAIVMLVSFGMMFLFCRQVLASGCGFTSGFALNLEGTHIYISICQIEA